jgi:Phage tail assembly chaperone proteins, E, or 41 or 14
MAEQNPNDPTFVEKPQAKQAAPQAAPVTEEEEPARVNGVAAWDGKLVLRKQVIANGEPVMEIVFREPTAADIERVGNPVLVGMYENTPKIHFDSAIMTQMMARLATVPPSTIRSMHPKDWNNGAWLLANFFMPDL